MKLASILTTIIFSAMAFAPSNANAGALLDPNLPYCLEATGGGSPWCGYRSLNQCEDSASGTGRACTDNLWMSATDEAAPSPRESMAEMRRTRGHR